MHVDSTSGLESNVGQKVNTLVMLCASSIVRHLMGRGGEAALRRCFFFSDAWNCCPCHSRVNPHLGLDH